jgi:CHAT domain-containing protein
VVTVQVKFVDAGELYVSWRWEHALHEPRVLVLPRALVQDALDSLAQAVPSPLPGESAGSALVRSLTHGPLLDRSREIVLSEQLARALFPQQLAAELNALIEQGIRPHLRIQPSPSTALVPWEALRVDEGTRTVHHADVSILAPATVRNALARQVSPFDPLGTVVGVLDPRVPGLRPVLGAVGPELAALAARQVPGGIGCDVDRDFLAKALSTAARFLYVGHVTTGGHGLDARLHLSHRPLTAADIVLGSWRIPSRVALVACESGGDNRFAEPSGLVTAMINGGAEHVLSTRWTLPTDAGLAQLASLAGSVLQDAVIAVDAIQSAPNPISALAGWQRDQANHWEETGDPTYSPVVWAAFATAWAPTERHGNLPGGTSV